MQTLPRQELGERRRQRAVDTLGLTEGVGHERLDRITRLARSITGVDACAVTMIDRNRVWFPSITGFDSEPVLREQTFCNLTAEEDAVLVIPDAREDPRFAGLDLVRGDHVRFYAGAPLRDSAGNVLGTLCLFDARVRTLSADQLAMFTDLADWSRHELVAATETTQARRAQRALLPEAPVQTGPWTLRGACLPALTVGGDYFDYSITDGIAHLGVSDVMGKGLGAALVGAGMRAAARAGHRDVVGGADLGAVTTHLARVVWDDLQRAGSFVTAFVCVVDLADGTTRWVDAGAGLTVLVRHDGTIEPLAGDDRPIGILPDDEWFEHHTAIGPGDRLVIVSDGFLDLLDDPLHWWEPLGAMTRGAADVPTLLAEIDGLRATRPPGDDVTVLALFRDADTQVP